MKTQGTTRIWYLVPQGVMAVKLSKFYLVQISLILVQVPIPILTGQRRNQIHTEKLLVQG